MKKDQAMLRESFSRRTFLKSGAASGITIFLGKIAATGMTVQPGASHDEAVRMIAPPKGTVLPGFLAAKLRWEYVWDPPPGISLTVAPQHDPQHPIAQVTLPGSVNTYALPLVPNETYSWQLYPINEQGRPTAAVVKGTFSTGPVRLLEDAPLDEQFKYVRKDAHNTYFVSSLPHVEEPLSPWYDVKRYTMAPPPKFADVKDAFPQPVFDGHPDALEAYWYCWKILLDVGYFAPRHSNHQAIANICGMPVWGPWGSNTVEDQFTIMHFAKYGNQAYPFITQFDNAYARQHENGFICQESDNDNFEMFICHPAKIPYLVGYAEWDYYQNSGDLARLRRVFMPLVKNYEWFLTYMRHNPHGAYGFTTPARREEKCEIGPDNLEFAATVFRAAEALAMARIATLVGRPDLAKFFHAEHRELGDYINREFWDDEYHLYNDRCDPNSLFAKYRDPKLVGKFVTQPLPGDINKPVYTFMPLFAEIAPPERVRPLKRLVQDPEKGFGWPTGIAYYSRDSAPQGFEHDASYFGPTKHNISVWAPLQYLVQQGFKQYGERAVAQEAAERYFGAVVAAYAKDRQIGEMMNPTTPDNMGAPNFIGWSGLAPIANFIEYVLGFDIDMPQQTITWHLHRTERHGLQHLKIGEFYVDMLCDERATKDTPCQLTITSEGIFTLQTVLGEKKTRHRIPKGTSTFRVG